LWVHEALHINAEGARHRTSHEREMKRR
jgi:hypothetical protein